MISSDQLSELLANSDIGCIPNLPDTEYSLPTPEWISGPFARALGSLFAQLNFTWQPEKSDCDDFARFAAAYASLLHAQMGNKSGLAFGEFWYTRDSDGQGHAINVVVLRDRGGNLFLWFFEPQTQEFVPLTKKEINSCEFCRI